MGKRSQVYSELSIYSEKIAKEDYKRLFDTIVKKRVPILEFLDFSKWFSFSGFNIVVKRHSNSLKLYFGGKGIDAYTQSALFFPFRISEPKELEFAKSGFTLNTRFVSNVNMFDFMVKENAEEIKVKIIKLFGTYYGIGNFVNKDGGRGFIYLGKPTKFFEIDLEKNPQFYIELLDPIPKAVYMKSNEPIFIADEATIGVDSFSALQHSLIVGSSGTGKSKFIEIMIRAIKKKYGDGVRILVIDPHGEFSKTFEGEKVVDYEHNYIEPFDVGKNKSPLITQLVAQLITSTIAQENKYAERVVFYAVHMLASVDQLNLENINLLLTDSAKRMEFSSQCQNDEVRRFFDEEFQNIYLHHFNDAILPVINFIGEYQLYLGKDRKLEKLENVLREHNITVVSFNPHYFGRKIIRFFAGSIINQIYMMAISEKLDRPTILVVDEFPTVESKVTKDILAETRKFNLYMHVSAQYMGQLSKVVMDALISNVRNIVAFKCTREDAKILVSMMEIKVEEFFKKRVSPSELEESKKEMFLKLHPREAIVRLFDGTKYILPMKVKTADLEKWRSAYDSKRLSGQSREYDPNKPNVNEGERKTETRFESRTERSVEREPSRNETMGRSAMITEEKPGPNTARTEGGAPSPNETKKTDDENPFKKRKLD